MFTPQTIQTLHNLRSGWGFPSAIHQFIPLHPEWSLYY
jgi:hypothetical protein